MNKEIFKLAKETGVIQWDKISSGAITPDHESVVNVIRFANLLIKEVLKEVTDEVQYLDCQETAEAVVNRVKQTFELE